MSEANAKIFEFMQPEPECPCDNCGVETEGDDTSHEMRGGRYYLCNDCYENRSHGNGFSLSSLYE